MHENEQADLPPIPLTRLADELGCYPTGFSRMVKRRGFKPFKLRDMQNAPWFLSAEEAELFRAAVADERAYRVTPQDEMPAGFSGVYAVAAPSYGGDIRVKIGWSERMPDRFSTYRTLVPDLQVLAVWATREPWAERAALLCAQNIGRRVGEELFEFDDVPAALEVIGGMFGAMGLARADALPDGEE